VESALNSIVGRCLFALALQNPNISFVVRCRVRFSPNSSTQPLHRTPWASETRFSAAPIAARQPQPPRDPKKYPSVAMELPVEEPRSIRVPSSAIVTMRSPFFASANAKPAAQRTGKYDLPLSGDLSLHGKTILPSARARRKPGIPGRRERIVDAGQPPDASRDSGQLPARNCSSRSIHSFL
jgi:hypothetical protein